MGIFYSSMLNSGKKVGDVSAGGLEISIILKYRSIPENLIVPNFLSWRGKRHYSFSTEVAFNDLLGILLSIISLGYTIFTSQTLQEGSVFLLVLLLLISSVFTVTFLPSLNKSDKRFISVLISHAHTVCMEHIAFLLANPGFTESFMLKR